MKKIFASWLLNCLQRQEAGRINGGVAVGVGDADRRGKLLIGKGKVASREVKERKSFPWITLPDEIRSVLELETSKATLQEQNKA